MNARLENELREALTRIQPPEGFADRVVANLPERRRRPRFYLPVAAAAALALVYLGHFEQTRFQTQKRAAEVQQEVAFAFRLTAEKLAVIDQRLKKSAPELQIKEKGEL
jgi:hypothetical protein